GQLEHPGIVTVHDLLEPADAPPCYAMRLVQGRTLTEAVRDFHHRRAAGQAGPLELRGLLGCFVSVCQAVAYAHSRGVVHRDLKPENVRLGDFGEVVVLDWGLAKVLGRAGAEAGTAPVELATLEGDIGTRTGAVLGTLAYMAP